MRQLQHYATLSFADVWRCEGEWTQKHTMWSYVISEYTDLTDFIFPVDVDELFDSSRSQTARFTVVVGVKMFSTLCAALKV